MSILFIKYAKWLFGALLGNLGESLIRKLLHYNFAAESLHTINFVALFSKNVRFIVRNGEFASWMTKGKWTCWKVDFLLVNIFRYLLLRFLEFFGH